MLSNTSTGRRTADSKTFPEGRANCAKHTELAGHRWASLPKEAGASAAWVKKGSLALAVTGMVSGALFSQLQSGQSEDRADAASVSDAPTAADSVNLNFSGPWLESVAGEETDGKHRALGQASTEALEELLHGTAESGTGESHTAESRTGGNDGAQPAQAGKHRAQSSAADEGSTEASQSGANQPGASQSGGGNAAAGGGKHRAESSQPASEPLAGAGAATGEASSAPRSAAAHLGVEAATGPAPSLEAAVTGPSPDGDAVATTPGTDAPTTAAPTPTDDSARTTAPAPSPEPERDERTATAEPTDEPTDGTDGEAGLRIELPGLGSILP